jgi:hypothetical protein
VPCCEEDGVAEVERGEDVFVEEDDAGAAGDPYSG